jgi:circadian clock protein KaiB
MKQKRATLPLSNDKIILQLYVSGMSPKSMEAIENIKRLIDEYALENFELEIIDIYKNPEKASDHHIIFCPSLVKKSPLPKKVLIGTLSEKHKVISALGLIFKE